MYRQRQADAIRWFERALTLTKKRGSASTQISCEANWAVATSRSTKTTRPPSTSPVLCRFPATRALASLHIDLANMGVSTSAGAKLRRCDFPFPPALQIARKLGDEISVSKWLWNPRLPTRRWAIPLCPRVFRGNRKKWQKVLSYPRLRCQRT